jgi:hypothetical protein
MSFDEDRDDDDFDSDSDDDLERASNYVLDDSFFLEDYGLPKSRSMF